MKRALLILLCCVFVSPQQGVCKAQSNAAGRAPVGAESDARAFTMTWPGADDDGLKAPAGLIHRLPPDGTWARFENNDNYVTIASVGRALVAQQSCRWIEVILETGGHALIWKLLIPEERLGTESNILEQALSIWHCGLDGERRNITGMNLADEYGALTFILAGPDQEVQSLGTQVVETKLGRFECAGWTGRQFTTFDEREVNATFRQWVHEKAPFGVLRSEIEYTITFDDRVIQNKDSIALVEVGTGADSRISTASRSIKELIARPFAPAAGWRWALPPENCNWRSMATRGLAMNIHRSDEEFRFTLAHPSVPVPGAGQYRAVAFDRNQRRYEFSGVSGGASGTVGLKIFTLSHEILPHDQIKYVGIEKQHQETSQTPPSLVGKSLPSLVNVLFNSVPAQAEEKALLICFFDQAQRPSRYTITQLTGRAGELQKRGIIIVAIQASNADEDALHQWMRKNNISFPVGMVHREAEKTRFTWGICSLPWLILTDREHIVVAEGFGLEELDAKIKDADSSAKIPGDSNKVVGLVKGPDGRALSNVRVTEFQTDKDYTTDDDGTFASVFEPSDERRFFFAVDKSRELVGVGNLPPGDRQVEIKLVPAKIVSGLVVDPDGNPVKGAQVAPLPMTCFHVLTDERGRFDVGWSPSWEPREGLCLMVRSVDLNLAAMADIAEDTEIIEVKLSPALTLTGTVEDPNGKPVPSAQTSVSLIKGWGCGTPVKSAITNGHGRFELCCLPQRQEYGIQAQAKGFWRNQMTTGVINRTVAREEVGAIILKRPILSVSGIVVHAGGKPVTDIRVHLRGKGQPSLDTQTDGDGKFAFEKVCCGPIRISARNDALFGEIETEGGAKNLRLVIRPRIE